MTALTLESRLDGAVGGKTAAPFERAFGMHTVGDLLQHYPRRYVKPGELTTISNLPVGEDVTIIADVTQVNSRRMRQRKGHLLEVTISDGGGSMSLTFFNQPHRERELIPGRRGIFAGKIGVFNNKLQLAHPNYVLFDIGAAIGAETVDRVRRPIPIYPATGTLPSWKIASTIDVVLASLGDILDPLPQSLRDDFGLLDTRAALLQVHQPDSLDEAQQARKTLKMQEAFILQMALLQHRQLVRAWSATERPSGRLLAQFDEQLPFELTADQQQVGEQIRHDLVGQAPMNRLVQGEVGSGKTLVALRAMLQVAESGGQCAFIAPTEVLAAQHLRSITRLLGPELSPRLVPTLLTGQLSAAERRKTALRVASGQALIVVGTHALLSESTSFADLGLVVVDEQHRFGVEQRQALRSKGVSPHTLVLTATPIPRTVAMTVFGDLDVSTIRMLPTGRAETETFVAPIAERPAWFARVWDRAAEEVHKGHQVFVVCAAIDTDTGSVEDQALDSADDSSASGRTRWGVVQAAEMLRQLPRLGSLRIETLHGKMPAEHKDAVMRAFADGTIDILVATTVVEVGVDVPNASTMVVLEADRFGVSQLHQLRGRVGRGTVPGLCLLVTEAAAASPARARVDAVAGTRDGFALAEVDLELRGEGDVLGDAQSGIRSSLRLLKVMEDSEIIAAARHEAQSILDDDPLLRSYPGVLAALERRVSAAERSALAKS